MKQNVGRLIGFMGLYFFTLVYTHAQNDMNSQKVFEPVLLNNPVFIQAFDLTESFDGKIQLANLERRSDLIGCELEWSIDKIDAWNGTQMLLSGRIPLAKFVTDQNIEVPLDLPTNWKDGDLLNLTLLGNDGEILESLSKPIRKAKEGNQSYFKQRSPLVKHSISVRESTVDFQVEAGETLYIFGKGKGNLVLVKVGRRFINFTQNVDTGFFTSAIQKLTWKRLKDGSIQIKSTYQDNSKILTWTVFTNGELKMEISSHESMADLFGIGFSYPEEKVKNVQWIGEGSNELNESDYFKLWQNNPKSLLSDSSINSHLNGTYSNIHALFLETEDGSIEVRSETSDVSLGLASSEHKDISMATPKPDSLPFELKLYFTLQGDFSWLDSSSESVIPVNLKESKSDIPLLMVLWFRFS